MIFLDTCVWIELVAAKSPVTTTETRQAMLASKLLNSIKKDNKKIVTCREQILEIISAVQKYKMREYNRLCKEKAVSGVGNLKEFRQTSTFAQTQDLCHEACEDVNHMAELAVPDINVEDILNNLHLVDINDCIYYKFCSDKGIDLYTFDADFKKLAPTGMLHILS